MASGSGRSENGTQLKTQFLELANRFLQLDAGTDEERAAREATCRPIIEAVAAGAFRIVAMGEVKKGKSSFINALLETPDLLPIDSDVATSTVYKIVYGPRDRYTVFFESLEESKAGREPVEISREQLSEYGTENGNPGNQKQVAFIAIELRNPLLKEGVSFIDTPGVGGLFKRHRGITFQYAPKADVVLFFVDSVESVISRDEVEFLRELCQHTPRIVFVQTKSDKASAEQVVAWKDRNLEILSSILKVSPTAIPYFVVSSKLKRLADESQSLEDLTESGFGEFLRFFHAALIPQRDQLVLRKWIPSVQAAVLQGRVVLVDRLQIAQQAQADNRPRLDALQAELKAADVEFTQWQSEVWPTIQRDYRNAISQLDRMTLNELEDATLPEKTIAPMLDRLRDTCKTADQVLAMDEEVQSAHAAECNDRVNQILEKYEAGFQKAFQAATGQTIASLDSISRHLILVENRGQTEVDAGAYRTMRETYMGTMFMQSLGRRMGTVGAGGLSLLVAAGVMTMGGALVVAMVGGAALVANEIWSYVRGFKQSRERQVKEALKSAEAVMNKTSQAALRAGRRALNDLGAQLKQGAEEAFFEFQKQFRGTFEQRRKDVETARNRTIAERNAEVETLSNQLRQFDRIQKSIEEIWAKIR